ncbi:MAG: FAD-binding and (Fe-S)-binding domain-containing protein [Candidatus Odinarchaeia archaeon]
MADLSNKDEVISTKLSGVTETSLKRELGFKGDILLDEVSRNSLNSDASIYEITPSIVVYPKDVEDVISIVKFAYAHKIPIHPRGASTGLAGQALGEGIVIDFTKYMRSLEEISSSKSDIYSIWVEPGVVYAELNDYLANYNKIFPPDPASGDACTIGGMIANNSSGSHAVKYGSTVDNIEELDVVLYDGTLIRTQPYNIHSPSFKKILNENTPTGKLHKLVYDIIIKNKKLLEEHKLDVEKNCSGYQLDKILVGDTFNLSKLFVGSEGTLGVVVRARIKVMDTPTEKGIILLYFDDLNKAGNAVSILREYEPASIEIFDKVYIDLIRERYPLYKKKFNPNIEALLLTEFDGSNIEEIKEKISTITDRLTKKEKLAFYVRYSFDKKEQEELWDIRRVAVPILNSPKGRKKVTPFIEDAAIHHTKLPRYIKFLRRIFKKYNVKSVIYGHASMGNIHTRPLLDLKRASDIKKMRAIANDVFEEIKKLNGTISGEHGDGRVRTQFLRRQYGKVFDLFMKIKKYLDPENILNPGIKTNLDPSFMVSDLRYGANYTVNKKFLEDLFLFKEKEFIEEIEKCHGCGKCTNILSNTTMCPVFKLSHDERDSPRGKANVFRRLLKGQLSEKIIETDSFRDFLYSCIVCGACLKECVSQVNIPKLVLEMKYRYVKKAAPPASFSEMEDVDNKETEPITCSLPEAFFTFEDKELVGLFEGEFINYFGINVLDEIKFVLRKLGYRIIVPDHHPSGSVSLRLGNFDRVIDKMVENVKAFKQLEDLPIVTLTPQTYYTLKYIYPQVLRNKKGVVDFSNRIIYVNNLIVEKILKQEITLSPANTAVNYFYLKSPFSRRAMVKDYSELELLKRIPKLNYTVLDYDYYISDVTKLNYSFNFREKVVSKINETTAISENNNIVFLTSSQETYDFLIKNLSKESMHIIQLVKQLMKN